MLIQNKKQKIAVWSRIEEQTFNELSKLAETHGVKESAVIRSIIEDFFSKQSQLKVDSTTTESES